MGRDKVQRRERVQAGSQEGWRWWVHLAASVLGSEVVLLRRGLAVWALDPETAVLVVEGELLGVEGLRAPGRGLLSQSLGVAGVGERAFAATASDCLLRGGEVLVSLAEKELPSGLGRVVILFGKYYPLILKSTVIL